MTGVEFIPWLVRAIADTLPEGTKIAEWATQEVIKRLAGGSVGAAGQALAKLLERFRSAPPAGGREALEALARDPSDPDAKVRLANALQDFLGRSDVDLTEAVAEEIAGAARQSS